MTKIKTNVNFNSSCVLSVADATGFKSGSNVDGFLAEGAFATSATDYHISDGWFINVLLYHKFYGSPIIINTKETYTNIQSVNVSGDYDENFKTENYTLTKDGVYTFKRLFIISKAYYDAKILANPFAFSTTPVIYYDGVLDKFYEVITGTPTVRTLAEVATKMTALHAGLLTSYKFVSTCYLSKCLYLLQKAVVDGNMKVCPAKVTDDVKAKRDFVSMTLDVIKYLKDDGHLTEVQRVIEGVDTCGMVCRSVGLKVESDCGCG